MKHRRVISVIAMVMLLASLAVTPVLAQPPPVLPCTFTGSVTLDGDPVADGTIITAKLVDDTVVGTAETENSEYGMLVPQVEGVPAQGDALNFYVDGNLATPSGDTATWEAGGGAAGFKTLNLAAFTGVVTRYTLTANVSPVGSGTTTPAAGTHSYVADTVVTLTATPASADWEFDHWTGDVACTGCASTTITMNSDKTVTAYFESTVVPPPAETFADWLYNTFIA